MCCVIACAGQIIDDSIVGDNLAWPVYAQPVNNTFLNDTTLTGSGGNPDLAPYKSYNYSESVEWYFAPQSVLQSTAFYNHILNYVSTITTDITAFNDFFNTNPATYQNQIGTHECNAQGYCTFAMTRPGSIGDGAMKGFSVAYQQPFGDTGFGMIANWTYSRDTTRIGESLPFNSKNSITIRPYHEKGPFSARIDYNWRSKYLAGGYIAGAPQATVANYTELDASVGWIFNKHWSINLSGLNLLHEAYDMYDVTPAMALNKYTNGRRYMLQLHYKL